MQLIAEIEGGGGRYIPLSKTGAIELDGLTHIVSTHIEFPEYAQALDCGIAVVKPSWVTLSVNKNKQASPRQHSPDPSQFFHDVVLTCAGLPAGDQDAIMAGVIALGGQYSGPLSKIVTHVVTTSMNSEKCQLVLDKGLCVKIVLPHWFDDCLKLGKKISERPYQLPDSELLTIGNVGPVRVNPSPFVQGASDAMPQAVPYLTPSSSPSDSRKHLNAFMSKTLFLGQDLSLSEHLNINIEGLIYHGGGTLVGSVADADIYVGQYRDTAEFSTAFRANKIIGNLSWLYNVINRNNWSNPLNRLLHYPVPRNGIPGFENMRISVSNYSGDARIYVQNLIKECGAEFTKSMRQDNTHLITAHTASEKCEAAREWNINVINHIWLEESYAKCVVQSLSNPRYSHFPARTNLGEVCGQTAIDPKRIEQVYVPKLTSPRKLAKSSPKKAVPVSSAPFGRSPLSAKEIDAIEGAEPAGEDEETEAEDEQPEVVKKRRGRPSKTAAASRHVSEEKENQSPLLNGSSGRASKVKAMGALHMQAGDIALFQREMKRKGGVTHGGRRSSVADNGDSPLPTGRARKRLSEEASYEATAEGSALSDGETQKQAKPSKKAKTIGTAACTAPELPPIKYRMAVTGYDRWVNDKHQESKDKITLRQLGVQLMVEPNKIDILVAPKIMRTRKFIAALVNAPVVVHSNFLDTALEQNELIDDPPLLEDKVNEAHYDFDLSDSLRRAQVNKGRLFRGWDIYVTKDLPGGFATYKDIITANGGAALLYAGRTGVMLKKRWANDPEAGEELQNQGGNAEFESVYLVSSGSNADKKLWKAFRDTAKKQNLVARIVKGDWLLNTAMRQHIRWEPKWDWANDACP